MEGKTPASPVVGSRVQSQQVLGNEERMKGSQIGAEEKKPALEITAKFFEKLYSSKIIQADALKNAVGVTCCTANFIHSPLLPAPSLSIQILFPGSGDVQLKALLPARTQTLSVPVRSPYCWL